MKERLSRVVPLALVAVLLAVALLAVSGISDPAFAQTRERFRWAIMDKMTVLEGGAIFNSDVTMTDDLDVAGDVSVDDLAVDGDITAGTNIYLDDGVWNGIQDGNIVFGDDTDAGLMWYEDGVNGDSLYQWSGENIFLMAATATNTVKVDTGNLVVGNGTPGETQDGEDAYIEGMLEVDGAAYFDSTSDFDGAVDIGGNELNLDADGDTSVTADTDDQIDFEIAGQDVISFTQPAAYMLMPLYARYGVIDKAASYTATQQESGALFTNAGASAEITITLPTATNGLGYCAYVYEAFTMTIALDGADQIHHLTNAAGDRLQNTGTAGDSICLYAKDGTYWVPMQEIGTWSDAD